jgi:hypothetical protein
MGIWVRSDCTIYVYLVLYIELPVVEKRRHPRLARGSSAEQPAPDLIRGPRGIGVFIVWTRDAGSPRGGGDDGRFVWEHCVFEL